jgi:hypothetical protein
MSGILSINLSENPEVMVPVKKAMADFRRKLINVRRAIKSRAHNALLLCLVWGVEAVWLIFLGWLIMWLLSE